MRGGATVAQGVQDGFRKVGFQRGWDTQSVPAGFLLPEPRAAPFARARRSVGAKWLLTGKVRTFSAELQRNLMHRDIVSLSARMSQIRLPRFR